MHKSSDTTADSQYRTKEVCIAKHPVARPVFCVYVSVYERLQFTAQFKTRYAVDERVEREES